MGITRILLADDHEVVRAGYRRLLESTSGIEVIAEASDGEEAYNDNNSNFPTSSSIKEEEVNQTGEYKIVVVVNKDIHKTIIVISNKPMTYASIVTKKVIGLTIVVFPSNRNYDVQDNK